MTPPGEAEVEGAAQATLVAAGALIEAPVHGRGGQKLGKIAEIMLTAGKGSIAYVVVATGGLLGIGEALHAVDWCDFTVDPESGRLSLDVDAADFAGRAGFDKDNWPVSAQANL